MKKIISIFIIFISLSFFLPFQVNANFWDSVREKKLSISKIIVYRKIYLRSIESKYSRVIGK